ncbi:unnamed protein product, partial [Symbiodinium sp. KB8]
MTARTKSNLSYVKQHRPELFKGKGTVEEADSSAPPGFKPTEDGLLHNPDTGVFLDTKGRRLWFDAKAKDYRELFEGISTPFGVAGGAATSTGTGTPPKHFFIPDLHRTALALKVDLSHLDRPAAVLAVLDSAAAAPHEKLIRRLAASRSEWKREDLCSALAEILSSSAQEAAGCLALALAVGHRVVAASVGGAKVMLFTESGSSASSGSTRGLAGVTVRCLEADTRSSAVAVLSLGDHGLTEAEVQAAIAAHLAQSRPRAAGVNLLRLCRGKGATGALAAGCLRLSSASSAPVGAAPATGQPAAKRQRVVGVDAREVPGRVRIRQILLRTWKGGSAPKPEDPVRRKPVQRSPEEPRDMQLRVLEGLLESKDNLPKSFTAACRATSECTVIRKLHIADLFAGKARISRWAELLSLKAVALDMSYSEHLNLLEDVGLALAVISIFRVKAGGLCVLGPQCSSWVWMSRGTTKRSPANPYGNKDIDC